MTDIIEVAILDGCPSEGKFIITWNYDGNDYSKPAYWNESGNLAWMMYGADVDTASEDYNASDYEVPPFLSAKCENIRFTKQH